MSSKSYLDQNRGFFTASKLKCYKKNPEEYYLQYVKEVHVEKNERHFIIGTAFDDLVTYRQVYGMNRVYDYEKWSMHDLAFSIQDKLLRYEDIEKEQLRLKVRLQKYYMDNWYCKKELVEELKRRPLEKRGGYSEYAIEKLKLPELRAIYYKDPANKKVRLTPAEARDILGMYAEALRQPKMKMFDRFGTQVLIQTTYLGQPIRGTIDRLAFIDKNGQNFLPEEVDEYIKTVWIDTRKELVKSEGIVAELRDRKTCGNFNTFEYDIEETYDYALQMSFYYTLVAVNYGVQSDVYLDVLGKKEPYGSIMYRLSKERIRPKVENEIKPLMQALIRAYQHDIWEPIEPLTGQPVSRYDMMRSKYYQHMRGALQEQYVQPQG